MQGTLLLWKEKKVIIQHEQEKFFAIENTIAKIKRTQQSRQILKETLTERTMKRHKDEKYVKNKQMEIQSAKSNI